MSFCPTGKTAYTRKDAKREARACRKLMYHCSICNQYHVGTKHVVNDPKKHKAKKGTRP